jgi:hypothetical protein
VFGWVLIEELLWIWIPCCSHMSFALSRFLVWPCVVISNFWIHDWVFCVVDSLSCSVTEC